MDVVGNSGYEQAVLELYRAGRDEFVSERKRLALALKARGEKEAASRLTKLTRPSAAVWAVNQLWWRQRERCEQLFALAARVRTGDVSASLEHRDLLSSLREQAISLLLSAGQPASEPTQRSVSINLAALAARGSFEPDLPGALSRDREPPGFEAMAGMSTSSSPGPAAKRAPASDVEVPTKLTLANQRTDPRRSEEEARLEQRRAAEQREREEQRRVAAQRAERERLEKERARRAEIRRRLSRERETASRERDACLRRVERLRNELTSAEAQLTKAELRLNDVDSQLAAYGDELLP